MSENSRITALDWQALVDEALRRRKAEKLTQREHAALANVSVPTIAAFDRGETTLSLAKAFDILRVVGLVEKPSEFSAQDTFVREALARWRSLTHELPEDSPGRFPHGWYRFDYALDGDLKVVNLDTFEGILRKAVPHHTGWPVFWFPKRSEVAPREIDGTIECWLSPEAENRAFGDAAHCDFWRAAPTGRLFLIRGYLEDGQETFPPRTIFDTTLPIWRIGEALVHAERLSSLMKKDEDSRITVRFRALFSGLSGRVLRAWANPLSDILFEGHSARSDEAALEAAIPAEEIKDHLAEHVTPLVASLYERFGVTGLSTARVKVEIDRMLSNRFG